MIMNSLAWPTYAAPNAHHAPPPFLTAAANCFSISMNSATWSDFTTTRVHVPQAAGRHLRRRRHAENGRACERSRNILASPGHQDPPSGAGPSHGPHDLTDSTRSPVDRQAKSAGYFALAYSASSFSACRRASGVSFWPVSMRPISRTRSLAPNSSTEDTVRPPDSCFDTR